MRTGVAVSIAAACLGLSAWAIYDVWRQKFVVPVETLARYMPVPLRDPVVQFHDSQRLLGQYVHLWRVDMSSEDKVRIADYCEEHPMWAPSPGTDRPDSVLMHSEYLGKRFAPCELAVIRPPEGGPQTFITYDGRYLTLETVSFW